MRTISSRKVGNDLNGDVKNILSGSPDNHLWARNQNIKDGIIFNKLHINTRTILLCELNFLFLEATKQTINMTAKCRNPTTPNRGDT
jgi:hypothetical protein